VRHVDHAHKAEDDGEAERHEEQDRRQGDSLKADLYALSQETPALDPLDGGGGGLLESRRRVGGDGDFPQPVQRVAAPRRRAGWRRSRAQAASRP